MSSHIALTSGILCLGAGSYAYITTKSRPSLVGGVGLATMFFGATYLIRKTDHQSPGHSVAAIAGSIALFIGVKRLQTLSSGVRIGPATLLLTGMLNVPYQFIKAYQWSN